MVFRVVLILILSLLFTDDAIARRKKSRKKAKPNTELKRQEAINTIIENSPKISALAGLDSLKTDNTQVNNNIEEFQLDSLQLGDLGEDLAELELENNIEVDLETFQMLWLDFITDESGKELTESGFAKSEMMDFIMNWLGTPYNFGSDSEKSIDCSAFTRRAIFNVLNVEIPRTAREQFEIGKAIERTNLQFGDLVYFKTRNYANITHVGIYLADGLFAHASSHSGVTISSLDSDYYARTFKGGKRLTNEDIVRLESLSKITEQKSTTKGKF